MPFDAAKLAADVEAFYQEVRPAEELAYAEGRGPNPATKDNATDFVGVEGVP